MTACIERISQSSVKWEEKTNYIYMLILTPLFRNLCYTWRKMVRVFCINFHVDSFVSHISPFFSKIEEPNSMTISLPEEVSQSNSENSQKFNEDPF